MIVDQPCNIDLLMQMLILFLAVELEFVRFHFEYFSTQMQPNDPECPEFFRQSQHEYGEDSSMYPHKF